MANRRTVTTGDGPTTESTSGDPNGMRLEPSAYKSVTWWFSLLLSLVACVVVLHQLPAADYQICSDSLAQVGKTAVVRTCHAVTVVDAWPVLLLVAVLLFPHVAELAIPGVLSIKRELTRQGERQAQIERQVLSLQQTQVVNLFTSEDWERFVRKESDFLGGSS